MEELVVCYICYDAPTKEKPYALEPRPSKCKGSIEIHKECLQNLIQTTKTHCGICKARYNIAYLPKRNGRGLYIESMPHGFKREYTVNEQGEIHGSYTIRHPNNQIISYSSYIHDKMEGPHIEYYPNGQIRTACRSKNNKLEGEFSEWYPDGSLKEESHYRDGLKHGECIRWKQENYIRVCTVFVYENGEIVSRTFADIESV